MAPIPSRIAPDGSGTGVSRERITLPVGIDALSYDPAIVIDSRCLLKRPTRCRINQVIQVRHCPIAVEESMEMPPSLNDQTASPTTCPLSFMRLARLHKLPGSVPKSVIVPLL